MKNIRGEQRHAKHQQSTKQRLDKRDKEMHCQSMTADNE